MKDSTRAILPIEDNPMDVDLTHRGFAGQKPCDPIDVARDVAQALDWIRRWEASEPPPGVILLDLKLPAPTTLEVLRQLKSHPPFSSIGVVMLTSSSEALDVSAAYVLGANSYIVKPVEFGKFLEIAQHIHVHWSVINEPQRVS